MDSPTLCAESKDEPALAVSTMRSLYEVCQQVTDGRRARGKRYDVAGVLVVLVLAKLANLYRNRGNYERAEPLQR